MVETLATSTKHFTIVHVFDAPRADIWRAWTDPDEAAFWWHPRGLETPRDSVEIDARVGGSFRYTMVAPDGTEYPTYGEYLEVVEPERLVFTWGDPAQPDEPQPVITVELAEHGDDGRQTEMTFTVRGVDGQPGDDYIYDGWVSAFDVLDERLGLQAQE
ncbi:MAG: SRPBCC domain-containing protein [Leifsonia flava]